MNSRDAGKAARERAPRSSHAVWEAPADRPDPIDILARDDVDRLAELLPIRYERMAASPFTFFRGAASIMASDLQHTPASGIVTQICGDAHLMNFGAYASPERRYVFDVNDFDETIGGGAWEWDLKRLAASVHVAGLSIALRARDCESAVAACARTYRERMHQYAGMHVLDVWYARIDEDVLAAAVGDAPDRAAAATLREPSRTSEQLFPKLVATADGAPHIADKPPLVYHPANDAGFEPGVKSALDRYRQSLSVERRALVGRFVFADAAYKVVGVGSVGTRCAVALLVAAPGDALFLQLKEARASVYERYLRKSPFKAHGERVVAGQRTMQAATDMFLGWARGDGNRSFYVRQLRDLKTSADVTGMDAAALRRYASVCGWALARAHARASGSAASIAGYLGPGDVFDEALCAFAASYARQNESDYRALLAAMADGRCPKHDGSPLEHPPGASF